MRLENKVAVVTGGANGIGKTTVEKFLQEGAKVAIVDYDETSGLAMLESMKAKGYEPIFIQTDVSNKASVEAMVQRVLDTYGQIDILINNAGVIADAKLDKMTEEAFDHVINVNLKGVYLCAQAVISSMVEQGHGKIINTSSVSGVYGNFGQTNYAAAKAGVIGMTKSWAKEYGRKGINVNAVAPGFIMTEMTQQMPEKVIEKLKQQIMLGKVGRPEDVANAYTYLASDEAAYVHGHVLHIDGGVVV